jgi:hypothetical protein
MRRQRKTAAAKLFAANPLALRYGSLSLQYVNTARILAIGETKFDSASAA